MAETKQQKKAKAKKPSKREVQMRLVGWDDEEFCRRCEPLVTDYLNCKRGRPAKGEAVKQRSVDVMIIGESPGKEEVRQGSFFVGPSGRELHRWLEEADIPERVVYIDNAVRCSLNRPFTYQSTQNKNKLITNCQPYLYSEIARLQPKVIVALGNATLKSLIGQSGIERWRGRPVKHRDFGCWIVPTFHPAAILRGRRADRENAIDDFVLVKKLMKKSLSFSRVMAKFVRTQAQFDQCMQEMERAGEYTFDIETNSLDHYAEGARILGLSLSASKNRGYFIPFYEPDASDEKESQWSDEKSIFYGTKKNFNRMKKLLAHKRKLKIAHNLAFDARWLEYFGMPVNWPIYDTIIANSVFDDIDNSLEALAYLHTDFGGYEKQLGPKKVAKKKLNFERYDPEALAEYGAKDAIATYIIKQHFDKNFAKHSAHTILPELFRLRVNLNQMELEGIKVDVRKSKKLQGEFEADVSKHANEVCKELKQQININSNPQLLTAMFDRGGLFSEFGKKRTTEKSYLQEMKRIIERKDDKKSARRQRQLRALNSLIEYRSVSKLKSTYLDSFVENNVQGRMHPHFTVHVVRTGRLSSFEPNLQNIPRASAIRSCFVSDGPDWSLVDMDYSQLELRIAAEYSNDKAMLEILNDPKGDIHSGVGEVAIRKPDGSAYPRKEFKEGDLRAKAKIVGFSVIYGKTIPGLAYDLGMTEQEAGAIFDHLFEGFPDLAWWIKKQHAFALENGYVTTLFGRRMPLPKANSADTLDQEAACRQAVNYPVQSTASDCLVISLNRVADYITKKKLHDRVKINLTVHDSLLFNVRKDFAAEFKEIGKSIMERPIPQIKRAKLFADAKTGRSWGKLK